MEADFPKSALEAQEHIRQIRRDKGLGDGPDQIGNNAADLESALSLLSDDLYQTTTHFLLELIQNADDNFYENECPTMSISYNPGQVQIDCNERGFSKKNVEAICRICHSTKSGRSKSAGFVGEKGIGFKAVFKIASTVWISSGHYSFRFDRDAHLGMIAPIWDEFPGKSAPHSTSILLKLSKGCDEKLIINELRSYDEKMLLFLRRLRRLEIDIKPGIFSLCKSSKTVLASQGRVSENPSMMVLKNNEVEKHYFVWRHEVDKLPKETRRPGIASSEIVLAFPNTGVKRNLPVDPVIESQNVYAFLPIRDGGLPFLLQADFLLPASREDIHVDSPWNKALAAAASTAYIDAVRNMDYFNESLRYKWVRYIPMEPAKTDFFETLRIDILTKLNNSDVLISQTGRRVKPAGLVMVPSHWRGPGGRPFMTNKSNEDTFLDAQYDQEKDWPYLSTLGVGFMNEHIFYDEMAKVLEGNPASFLQHKTKEWHASFARAVLKMNAHQMFSGLPIIPLRNGEWVSPYDKGSLYLPTSGTTLTIPEGIEINIVDPEACADPDRAKLFRQLGLAELNESHIRTSIQTTHKNPAFKPDKLRPEVLVSHAQYLFKTKSEAHQGTTLIWMAGESGTCLKSDSMYLPVDVSGAAFNTLPKGANQKYGFLHPAYLEVGGSNKQPWLVYLQNQHNVSLYPRLANDGYKPYNSPEDACLHDDFKLLLKGRVNHKWLLVLRDGWAFYARWLKPTTATSGTSPKGYSVQIVTCLRDRRVKCTGGARSEQIQNTYMPYDRLTKEYGTLAPFIDIPDPMSPAWVPLLECLRVGMTDNMEFYLKCLGGAKSDESISLEKIRGILHEIEDKIDGKYILDGKQKLPIVQETIRREGLIYVPPKGNGSGKSGTWVSQNDCFWRGEVWITQSVGLERIYPDLETLFRTHLHIPNLGIDHLIREATAMPLLAKPSVTYIEKLFLAFSSHVKHRGLTAKQKQQLQALEIFPIVSSSDNAAFEYLTSAANKKPWLIGDRAHLRAQFEFITPLLAFNAKFIMKIRRFLLALDLKDKFLSEVATSITEAHGVVKLNKALTQKYRTRSKYLIRLMPENQPDEKQLREKFRNVDVYTAPEIFQYWRAPLGLGEVQSTQADGAAFLECDYAGDLRIYTRDGYENEVYPYELAEQLQNFFNVPAEHRDLLTVALIAPEERVDEIFETRGIAPLIDDEQANEEEEEEAVYAPLVYSPGIGKKTRTGLGSDMRFLRLFSHMRFSPSFSNEADDSPPCPPSYGVAVARATQNAIGRPVEPRTFGGAVMLSSLKGSKKELEFVQNHGTVVGTPKNPPTLWDRIRSLVQRDSDVGEMIVSDILASVLGAQYDKENMFTPRDRRGNSGAAFNFTDAQGRFGAFLMRLDGMSGGAQGYTRLIYHLDVKTTDTESFRITQAEIDRARENSVHSQPDPDERAPSRHVSVLVHISDFRNEPKIRFLADPWDLFEDGQLILENTKTYQATLNLRFRQPVKDTSRDTGFNAVQIRSDGEPEEEDISPKYEKGKAPMETPEMTEVDFKVSVAGPSSGGRINSVVSASQ